MVESNERDNQWRKISLDFYDMRAEENKYPVVKRGSFGPIERRCLSARCFNRICNPRLNSMILIGMPLPPLQQHTTTNFYSPSTVHEQADPRQDGSSTIKTIAVIRESLPLLTNIYFRTHLSDK